MRNRTAVYIAVILLAGIWLTNCLLVHRNPLYLDSFFTIGSGAKLFFSGHGESTFMLYGMINPYVLEGLLKLVPNPEAPDLLRLFQAFLTLGTMILSSLALKTLQPSERSGNIFLLVFLAMLSSTVLLRESLEPLPETGLGFSVALMAYLLFRRFRRDWVQEILLGFTVALMIGFRPVAFILALPVFIALPERTAGRSAASIWRWVLLAGAVLIPLLMSAGDDTDIRPAVLTTAVIIAVSALAGFVTDVVKGNWRIWRGYLLISASALIAAYLLYPHYFNYFDDLMAQIDNYHTQVENPIGSLEGVLWNLLVSVGYLAVAFPGPFSMVGILVAVALLFKTKPRPLSRKLSLLLLGLLPYVLTVCRNDNLQPRYLISIMPVFFIISALGLMFAVRYSRLSWLLLLPLSLSMFQLGEAMTIVPVSAGMPAVLRELSHMPPQPVTVLSFGSCTPDYYQESDPVFYPVAPYIPPVYHVASPEQATYCVSFSDLPPGFEPIVQYGYIDEETNLHIRTSTDARWTSFIELLKKPHNWRTWGTAILGRRISARS